MAKKRTEWRRRSRAKKSYFKGSRLYQYNKKLGKKEEENTRSETQETVPEVPVISILNYFNLHLAALEPVIP